MAQIPPGLDHVPDPALELLGLGESAVDFAVPEYAPRRPSGGFLLAVWTTTGVGGGGGDLDDKDAAGAGLQGDFA
jgi:hypothetical protein